MNNNHEINRLRIGPVRRGSCLLRDHVELRNARTRRWRFWRNFRKDRVADLAADIVFPGDNDLVVDTSSMTDFGVPQLNLAGASCNFGTSATVWHCNYFRQEKSIDYIADSFGLALDLIGSSRRAAHAPSALPSKDRTERSAQRRECLQRLQRTHPPAATR